VPVAIDADQSGARRPEEEGIELAGERRPVRGDQVARRGSGRPDRRREEILLRRLRFRRCRRPDRDQGVVLDARQRQPARGETVVLAAWPAGERRLDVRVVQFVGVRAEAVDRQQRRAGRAGHPADVHAGAPAVHAVRGRGGARRVGGEDPLRSEAVREPAAELGRADRGRWQQDRRRGEPLVVDRAVGRHAWPDDA
jgi:hypothetical protein